MPIVPIVDSPTVSPQDGGLQPFSAGGGVEPVKNFAPEQGAKMGAAVQGAGQQMIKIGEMIQDQVFDANTKAAVSWYTSQAQKTLYDKETGYLNTLGVKSKDKYGETVESFNKIEESALVGLKSDIEKRMFSNAIASHKQSFAAQMDTHVVKQMRVYGAGEADALKDQYISLAITTKDENQRQQSTLNAITQAEAKADLLELPKDSVQRKEMILDVNNKITTGITNDLITKEDFSTAKNYLEAQRLEGKVENKDYQSLMRTINVGNEKQEATYNADKIFTTALPPKNAEKETVIDFIMKRLEGGYKEDDAGAGPTNHGINSKSYFGLKDAKNLTEAQKNFIKNLTPDQAKDIYRKRYWDAINLDKVDPSIRLMAFDTAVNMGPPIAEKFIKESGGDINKFAQLRKDRYAKIAAGNDDKKEFLTAWNKRVDTILNLSRGDSEPLQDQLARADKIENRDVREMTKAKIKALNTERDSAIDNDYKNNYDKAFEIASENSTAWTKIPADMLAKIKPADIQKLRDAADRKSDQETLLYVSTHPETWAPNKIGNYRQLLSESDFRNFATKGQDPDYGKAKVDAVSYEQNQLQEKLIKFGLKNLVTPKKDSADAEERIKLNALLERNIDVAQKAKKGKLTIDETNEIIKNLLTPIKVKAEKTWFDSSEETEVPAFRVKATANVIVPPAEKEEIIKKLKAANKPYDDWAVGEAYIATRKIK